ncbi:MAG: ABC transporter ATP-binding protein [Oscillospiraceae bacterium]|mgnify:CR=1 FL=1|nr:ABC transporter ATP-binding protein [Oscillospiraceae bacterium]
MLEIKNITKIFNAGTVNEKVAIDGLSLTLNDGDFVTVIGGNGAGKSTLQNLIAGTYLPDGGEILIDGTNVTRLPEFKRAKYIGRVFQDPMVGTAADMWIEENMALAKQRGKRRGLSWSISQSDREEFKKQLSVLGLELENRLSTKVGLLSGGQRQAITLLMAAMNHPKLLLLDEHTAALDPKTAAKVLEITQHLVEADKLTTLMITHNMRDAIAIGNRLIMMNNGKIIYDISGEEKKKLTVSALMDLFARASDGNFANDRMLLG